jgi:hypothetical protein
MSERDGRVLRLEVPIDTDDEVDALRGALLAARATELAEIRRRSGRLSFGYGSETARDTMTDEVGQHERRWTMLDRVLTALATAAGRRDD